MKAKSTLFRISYVLTVAALVLTMLKVSKLERLYQQLQQTSHHQAFESWWETTTEQKEPGPGAIVRFKKDSFNPNKVKTMVYWRTVDGVYRFQDPETGETEIYLPEN